MSGKDQVVHEAEKFTVIRMENGNVGLKFKCQGPDSDLGDLVAPMAHEIAMLADELRNRKNV